MNIWKFIYLNCGEWYEDMIDHRSYIHNWSSREIKAWKKNWSLNGTRTHDLCDSGAALYQPSYQANWELVTLWACNIPVDGEECKWLHEISFIWTAEKDMKTWLIIAIIHTTWAVVKLKPEKKFRPERDSNPRPLRYRCSAVPTELLSQPGAGHILSS